MRVLILFFSLIFLGLVGFTVCYELQKNHAGIEIVMPFFPVTSDLKY